MTVAEHTRHCSCPHLPADRARGLEYLHKLFPRASQGELVRAYDLASGHDTTRYHERALNNVTPPDAEGHQFWIGRAEHGRPHVTYKGVRMLVEKWLWLRAGYPDVGDLVRRPSVCHLGECIAPDHHQLIRQGTRVGPSALSEDMRQWLEAHPKINARPQRWTKGPRGEECPRGGAAHKGFKVYGDPRLRHSYCPECAADERARRLEQRRWQAADDRYLHTLAYDDAPDPTPDTASLQAQIDAMLEEPDADS